MWTAVVYCSLSKSMLHLKNFPPTPILGTDYNIPPHIHSHLTLKTPSIASAYPLPCAWPHLAPFTKIPRPTNDVFNRMLKYVFT